GDGAVHDSITDAATIWPAAGNNAAPEARWDRTGEHVAAEDAQARVARVVLVRRMIRSTARQPAGAGGKVHLDQVGNVDPGDVAAAGLRRFERSVLQHDQVDQLAEFGVLRVFPEQGSILAWAGAAVEVLVRKR